MGSGEPTEVFCLCLEVKISLKTAKNGHFEGYFSVFESKLSTFGVIFAIFWAILLLAAEGDTAKRLTEVPVVVARGADVA